MRGGWIAVGLLVPVLWADEPDGPAAGRLDGRAVPPAPAARVFDDARIFRMEPERLELMEERLREFHERTGFEVYAAFLESLIGRSLTGECQKLRLAWLGDKPGVVFAMNTDNGDFTLAWSEPSTRAAGTEMPAFGAVEVGPAERKKIEARLSSLPKPGVRSVEDAGKLVRVLLDGLEEAVAPVEPDEPRRGRLMVLALGLGSAMLLIALLAGAAVRRADRRVRDRLFFPRIEVGERLKAPRGGGKVSSRNFGASSS